jgi:anti-sigma-K factor RskA
MDEPHTDPNGCGGNAAPYVLGALTEQESVDFVSHMESCAVCREEVAALQVVAANLPAAAPQMSVPPEVKRRVMATVHEEARLRRGGEPERARDSSRAPRFTWRPALLVASLVAILALAVIVLPGGGGGASTRVISAQVTPQAASASLRVSGPHAELDIAGMPVLPADRVYEVWIKRNGVAEATDALFNVTSAGNASVDVPGDLAGAQAVMVTAEPLGGSQVPTGKPVIVANLT